LKNSIAIEEDVLINHVEKICESPEFESKLVLCRFLNYIVSETLSGRGDAIKAFSIGVDVFNRDEDFDPGQDTLVRINAIRLRRTLDLYYSKTGKYDDIRINIPKGGYVPEFKMISDSISETGEEEAGKKHSKKKPKNVSLDPSIAIFTFNDISGRPENDYFVRGFPYKLMNELTKFEDLHVHNCLNITEYPETGSPLHASLLEKGIRFALGGALKLDRDHIDILVDLRDLASGKQIWCDKYSRKIRGHNLIQIEESISADVSGKLGSEYGIMLQRLTQDAKRQKPGKLTTYTAVLKYYNTQFNPGPDAVREAFEALNIAIEKDPQSGLAHACLAALHGNRFGLDYPGAEKSYIALGDLAEKAYKLDPYSLFVKIVLAFKCFMYEEKDRFFYLANRIVEQNPKGSLRLGALGFHLSLYGDWERGKSILDRVMHANMEYPRYYHGATALYYYRKKRYKNAYKEVMGYKGTGYWWEQMLNIAILGQMRRSGEARHHIENLHKVKPDFTVKAHDLISRFVKEESLVIHIIQGLQKSGMSILEDTSETVP
jgi:adenylate cyclase